MMFGGWESRFLALTYLRFSVFIGRHQVSFSLGNQATSKGVPTSRFQIGVARGVGIFVWVGNESWKTSSRGSRS